MSRFKVKPFKDPLGSATHLFSEAFEGIVPDQDFQIVVRRSGHGVIRRETLSRIRTGELKTRELQTIAEKYGGEDGELDTENLTDEQMAELATMDAANAWVAPLLIEDLIGLPIIDEDGATMAVTLSEHPEEFDETVEWLLTEYPDLAVLVGVWARDAEKRYQDYVGSAKKGSGSGSTPKPGAKQKRSASTTPTESDSTLSSEPQSAQAS